MDVEAYITGTRLRKTIRGILAQTDETITNSEKTLNKKTPKLMILSDEIVKPAPKTTKNVHKSSNTATKLPIKIDLTECTGSPKLPIKKKSRQQNHVKDTAMLSVNINMQEQPEWKPLPTNNVLKTLQAQPKRSSIDGKAMKSSVQKVAKSPSSVNKPVNSPSTVRKTVNTASSFHKPKISISLVHKTVQPESSVQKCEISVLSTPKAAKSASAVHKPLNSSTSVSKAENSKSSVQKPVNSSSSVDEIVNWVSSVHQPEISPSSVDSKATSVQKTVKSTSTIKPVKSSPPTKCSNEKLKVTRSTKKNLNASTEVKPKSSKISPKTTSSPPVSTTTVINQSETPHSQQQIETNVKQATSSEPCTSAAPCKLVKKRRKKRFRNLYTSSDDEMPYTASCSTTTPVRITCEPLGSTPTTPTGTRRTPKVEIKAQYIFHNSDESLTRKKTVPAPPTPVKRESKSEADTSACFSDDSISSIHSKISMISDFCLNETRNSSLEESTLAPAEESVLAPAENFVEESAVAPEEKSVEKSALAPAKNSPEESALASAENFTEEATQVESQETTESILIQVMHEANTNPGDIICAYDEDGQKIYMQRGEGDQLILLADEDAQEIEKALQLANLDEEGSEVLPLNQVEQEVENKIDLTPEMETKEFVDPPKVEIEATEPVKVEEAPAENCSVEKELLEDSKIEDMVAEDLKIEEELLDDSKFLEEPVDDPQVSTEIAEEPNKMDELIEPSVEEGHVQEVLKVVQPVNNTQEPSKDTKLDDTAIINEESVKTDVVEDITNPVEETRPEDMATEFEEFLEPVDVGNEEIISEEEENPQEGVEIPITDAGNDDEEPVYVLSETNPLSKRVTNIATPLEIAFAQTMEEHLQNIHSNMHNQSKLLLLEKPVDKMSKNNNQSSPENVIPLEVLDTAEGPRIAADIDTILKVQSQCRIVEYQCSDSDEYDGREALDMEQLSHTDITRMVLGEGFEATLVKDEDMAVDLLKHPPNYKPPPIVLPLVPVSIAPLINGPPSPPISEDKIPIKTSSAKNKTPSTQKQKSFKNRHKVDKVVRIRNRSNGKIVKKVNYTRPILHVTADSEPHVPLEDDEPPMKRKRKPKSLSKYNLEYDVGTSSQSDASICEQFVSEPSLKTTESAPMKRKKSKNSPVPSLESKDKEDPKSLKTASPKTPLESSSVSDANTEDSDTLKPKKTAKKRRKLSNTPKSVVSPVETSEKDAKNTPALINTPEMLPKEEGVSIVETSEKDIENIPAVINTPVTNDVKSSPEAEVKLNGSIKIDDTPPTSTPESIKESQQDHFVTPKVLDAPIPETSSTSTSRRRRTRSGILEVTPDSELNTPRRTRSSRRTSRPSIEPPTVQVPCDPATNNNNNDEKIDNESVEAQLNGSNLDIVIDEVARGAGSENIEQPTIKLPEENESKTQPTTPKTKSPLKIKIKNLVSPQKKKKLPVIDDQIKAIIDSVVASTAEARTDIDSVEASTHDEDADVVFIKDNQNEPPIEIKDDPEIVINLPPENFEDEVEPAVQEDIEDKIKVEREDDEELPPDPEPFNIGDLVMARLSTFSYWPCMITEEPLMRKHRRQIGKGLSYHVRFFGDNGRRAWVVKTSILPYNGPDTLGKYREELLQKQKAKRNKFLAKEILATKVSSKSLKAWNTGISEAELLVDKSVKERHEFFFQMFATKRERALEAKRKRKLSETEEKPSKEKLDEQMLLAQETPKQAKKKRKVDSVPADLIPKEESDDEGPPILEKISPSLMATAPKRKRTSTSTGKKNGNSLGESNASKTNYVLEDLQMIMNGSLGLQNDNTNVADDMPLIKKEVEKEESKTQPKKSKKNKTSQETKEKNEPLILKQLSDLKLPLKIRTQTDLTSDISDTDSSSKHSVQSTGNRRILFKDVPRIPVCQMCYQNQGIVLKCKGKCCGFYHAECCQIKTEENAIVNLMDDIIDLTENNTDEITEGKSQIEDESGEQIKGKKLIEDNFICMNCKLNLDPVCFACNSSSYLDKHERRFKCSINGCGHYFHRECLAFWPQASIDHSKSDKFVFQCPMHNCHSCICENPKSYHGVVPMSKTARCLKCPSTYHINSFCIPAGTEILSHTQIICPRHVEHRNKRYTINANWCFICSRGGDLLCCETCPTSVHQECISINLRPDDTFVCEDCESGRLPLYDEIVWAKFAHYKWWPGVILFPEDVPESVRNFAHRPGEFVVRFYGTHDHHWFALGRVFLFQEDDKDGNTLAHRRDLPFKRAVAEAKAAWSCKMELKKQRTLEKRKSEKPAPYTKIRVNRMIGNVKPSDGNISKATACTCNEEMWNPCGPDSDCLNRLLMTECNPDICPAKFKCQNQRFDKRQYPPLMPFKTEERGWGLRCSEAITKGQFVIEYVGEVIDNEEYQRRIKRMHEEKLENYYFLTIDATRTIDAGPKGNLARFMNHCCKPNCETQKWTVKGDTRVGLFALEDIPPNTELTFNYHLESIGEDKKVCHCGAENCTGLLGVKNKQSTKKNKNKKKSTPMQATNANDTLKSTSTCFLCHLTKTDVECRTCHKSYHLTCLEIEIKPQGKWICPRHYCNICTKRTIRSCTSCLEAYCPNHSSGRIVFKEGLGYYHCNRHNPDELPEMSSAIALNANES